MTKQEIREFYKAKRKGLSHKVRLKLDDLMLISFQQFNYGQIKTLLTYWPLTERGEPNTQLFSSYLRHSIPGLVICYPVTDHTHKQMDAVAIHEETEYVTNANGLTEPKEGQIIPPSQIDMVLVPLLAFDVSGYRVGYGKGYYDRYLKDCRMDIVKVGLSYFDPLDEITDTGQFDVPLSLCITPQKSYEF